MLGALLIAGARQGSPTPAADLPWLSDRHYRICLRVDPGPRAARGGRPRSNSPASVDLDLDRSLAGMGGGPADPETVEVVAFTASGEPRPFDAAASGRERWRVPHRIDRYFGTSRLTLSFVVSDESCTRFAVFFDAAGRARPEPVRRPGLVGDGDHFRQAYGPREINASHFDQFFDFDGDGDLDLFKGGVEPFVYCYENTGRNRMVERGRLTSGGELMVLPKSAAANRSWVTVAFHDWDADGDPDFIPSFGDGPDRNRFVLYRNTTREHGGRLTFTRHGPLSTVSGVPVGGGPHEGGWFPSVAFVPDWDGDGGGRTDLLVGTNNHCYLYRSLGPGPDGLPRLADPVTMQAGGTDIVLTNPRFDCADVDADGDLDLFAGSQPGPVYWFRNSGTRREPVLERGIIVAYGGRYLIGDAHSGVKVADFDGDARLDLVTGRFWERADLDHPAAPRYFGGLHRQVGARLAPRFERTPLPSTRSTPSTPYLEGFPICDAVRQNGVRSVDWDRDGRRDLLAGDTDGFIWLFRGRGSRLRPLFAPGERLRAGRAAGPPFSVAGRGGHARLDICDWNADGRRDLVVADGHGSVTLFAGEGSGEPVRAGGSPVQAGGRASALVCDWDGDGRQDLVMAGEGGYRLFANRGTAARPDLAPGQPILFGGRPAQYIRPNLGSFVDWDGDGARDLIGCNFENRILLYRNLARPGAEPRFEAPEGSVLLAPWTVQMISGADSVDWNGDGDLDLLTGQGHGGSGLRFYERDFIEDSLHRTHPRVSVLAVSRRS